MAYMERLLAHYTGQSRLDADTLKTLAESVEKGRAAAGPSGSRPDADVNMDPEVAADVDVKSQSSDSFQVDEITVQPLENNITRKILSSEPGLQHSDEVVADHELDYSGEFSHWNFSMRIKQWIEQCVNVRWNCRRPL